MANNVTTLTNLIRKYHSAPPDVVTFQLPLYAWLCVLLHVLIECSDTCSSSKQLYCIVIDIVAKHYFYNTVVKVTSIQIKLPNMLLS